MHFGIGNANICSQLDCRSIFHVVNGSFELYTLPTTDRYEQSGEYRKQHVRDVDIRKEFGFPPFFLIPTGLMVGLVLGLAIIFFVPLY
jgi:hypothetical protein